MMIAFESRKRSACPHKLTPLNLELPFSFIDFYRKVNVVVMMMVVVMIMMSISKLIVNYIFTERPREEILAKQ